MLGKHCPARAREAHGLIRIRIKKPIMERDFRSLLSFAKCWCRPGASIQSRDPLGAALRRPLRIYEILGIHTMRLTTLVHHAMPFVAVSAGLLVLIRPQLLNYVVAACLILTGVVWLNGLYHFVR